MQINPRSLGSWYVKGTEEATLEVNFSFPLARHDPKNIGLICLEKKREIEFLDSFGFKSPVLPSPFTKLKKRVCFLFTEMFCPNSFSPILEF